MTYPKDSRTAPSRRRDISDRVGRLGRAPRRAGCYEAGLLLAGWLGAGESTIAGWTDDRIEPDP